MELFQSRYIPSTDPWEPNFGGWFFANGTVPCFVYKERGNVCLLPLTSDVPTIIHTNLGHEILPLPWHWIFLEHGGSSYLMVMPDAVIDLRQGKQLSYIPEPLRAKCLARIHPEKYFVEHQFCFDDYCISHKGNCGYRCTKTGEILWEFTGRAYLYTDIIRWNNHVFFGTAGHGGYFYILDIDSGESLASIKTGGTASIAQMDHLCFVASRGTKRNRSKLLCLDLRDGRIVQELDLHGEVTEDSKLQLIGQHLHIVTFEYRGEHLQNAIWNTVNI